MPNAVDPIPRRLNDLFVYGDPDAPLEPLCSQETIVVVQTIAQLIFRGAFCVLVPIMLASVAPIAFQAVVLTATAIGATFLAAFFFNPDNFYTPPSTPSGEAKPLQGAGPAAVIAAPQPLAPEVPRGYDNAGNDCWLNSCMQLIDSDPALRQWIRNPLPPFAPPPAHPDQDPAIYQRHVAMKQEEYEQFVPVHAAFRRFAAHCDAAIQQGVPIVQVSTRALRVAIHRINDRIARGSVQEDPHEGITNLLQMISPENKIRLRQYIHLDPGEFPIRGHADGIIPHEDPPDWSIPIAIQGVRPNLPDMIRYHFDEAIYDPNNKVPRIGEDGARHLYRLTRKRYELIEAPPMLRFQLKRFAYRKEADTFLSKIPLLKYLFPSRGEFQAVKDETPVSIPHQLQVPVGAERQDYQLNAFNCHFGDTARSGHYVAYVRKMVNGIEQWYFCNDQMVTPVDRLKVDQVLATGAPYMVWYERV